MIVGPSRSPSALLFLLERSRLAWAALPDQPLTTTTMPAGMLKGASAGMLGALRQRQ